VASGDISSSWRDVFDDLQVMLPVLFRIKPTIFKGRDSNHCMRIATTKFAAKHQAYQIMKISFCYLRDLSLPPILKLRLSMKQKVRAKTLTQDSRTIVGYVTTLILFDCPPNLTIVDRKYHPSAGECQFGCPVIPNQHSRSADF